MLTKGQKDALARKAQQIISDAENNARKAYVKTWKPKEELKEFLEKFEEMNKAYKKFQALNDELKTDYNYYSTFYEVGGHKICIGMNGADLYNEFLKQLCIKDTQKYIDSLNLPTSTDIFDDIELQSLDKNFDLDAFLTKYKDIYTI